jgi:uncharacterized protein (TIGR02001 family)
MHTNLGENLMVHFVRKSAAFAATAMFLAATGLPAVSHAQDVTTSVTVIATSDYLFRGGTQNLHKPSIQASFDVTAGPFYVGAFAANMDFNTDANLEVDLYAGYKPKWGAVQMDFAVLGYLYPQEDPLNLMEVKAAATVANEVGASATFSYFYSPEWGKGGPDSNYVELAGTLPLSNAKVGPFALSANASLGHQNFGPGAIADYTNWKLSLSGAAEKGWFTELAWTDTDLDTDGFKGVLSFTVKKTF